MSCSPRSAPRSLRTRERTMPSGQCEVREAASWPLQPRPLPRVQGRQHRRPGHHPPGHLRQLRRRRRPVQRDGPGGRAGQGKSGPEGGGAAPGFQRSRLVRCARFRGQAGNCRGRAGGKRRPWRKRGGAHGQRDVRGLLRKMNISPRRRREHRDSLANRQGVIPNGLLLRASGQSIFICPASGGTNKKFSLCALCLCGESSP